MVKDYVQVYCSLLKRPSLTERAAVMSRPRLRRRSKELAAVRAALSRER
jgi:hypothetical protein